MDKGQWSVFKIIGQWSQACGERSRRASQLTEKMNSQPGPPIRRVLRQDAARTHRRAQPGQPISYTSEGCAVVASGRTEHSRRPDL